MNRTRILALMAQAAHEPTPDEKNLDEAHWKVLEKFVELIELETKLTPYSFLGPDVQTETQDRSMQAAIDVITERVRQVTEEGWTMRHDDSHRRGELPAAAACYALWAAHQSDESEYWKKQYSQSAQLCWPWDQEWWKPGQRFGTGRVPDIRRDLVRAGALIQAAIEREDRCEAMEKRAAQSNTGGS